MYIYIYIYILTAPLVLASSSREVSEGERLESRSMRVCLSRSVTESRISYLSRSVPESRISYLNRRVPESRISYLNRRVLLKGSGLPGSRCVSFGRGDDTVGNPHRTQICIFEFVELIPLLKLYKQLSVEQFEATVS